jgi:Zn-finger nucleic acid-binding protein
MADATILTCPKCRGEMRTYERNGIVIDQCEECRGIFLDRGELEQLLDQERGHDRRDERDERDERGKDKHDDHYRAHHYDDDRDRDEHHDDDDEKGRRGRRRTSPTQFLSDLLGGGE